MSNTLATAPAAKTVEKFTQEHIELADTVVALTSRWTTDRPWTREARADRTKTTRIYGAVDTFAKEEDDAMPYAGERLYTEKEQPRLYASLSDEDRQVMDDKVEEYRAWKNNTLKVARAGVKPAVLALLADTDLVFVPKVENEAPRFAFSIHAGCSTCPCSPGFVLNGQVRNARGEVVDMFFETR